MTWVTLRQPRGPRSSALRQGPARYWRLALYAPAASWRFGNRVRFSMWSRFSAVPGEQVGAAGELVVLVGLVDGHRAAGSGERPRLDLAHRRVDEVLGLVPGMASRGPAAVVAARIGEVERRPEAQRRREPGVGSRGSRRSPDSAAWARRRRRRPRVREITQGPAAADALVAELLPGVHRDAREGRSGGRWHGFRATSRAHFRMKRTPRWLVRHLSRVESDVRAHELGSTVRVGEAREGGGDARASERLAIGGIRAASGRLRGARSESGRAVRMIRKVPRRGAAAGGTALNPATRPAPARPASRSGSRWP